MKQPRRGRDSFVSSGGGAGGRRAKGEIGANLLVHSDRHTENCKPGSTMLDLALQSEPDPRVVGLKGPQAALRGGPKRRIHARKDAESSETFSFSSADTRVRPTAIGPFLRQQLC